MPFQVQRLTDGTPRCAVLALDATDYSRCPGAQYGQIALEREACKAMCGFSADDKRFFGETVPIATGKWGSGVFAGELELKFALQLLAGTLLPTQHSPHSC